MWPFSSNHSYLGVDIGTAGIKVVELKKSNSGISLVNYGFSEKRVEEIESHGKPDAQKVANTIVGICRSSNISTRDVVASLPTFSVFSSVLSLTNIPEKSLDAAVHWEAKKIIPLPLDEMVLDWKKIDQNIDNSNNVHVKILITGAPKTLVNSYVSIFKIAQLNLLSLETETFSLSRSLLGNDPAPAMVVEIGASTTDISIIDHNIPFFTRSLDIGGTFMTKAISENLKIGLAQAEQFKYDLGINSLDAQNDIVPKVITETLSPLLNEISYSLNLIKEKNGLEVEKIILSGGSSLLLNLVKYLEKELNKKVIIGNPWARIIYPRSLEKNLLEIGPRMSVAIGLALREL